MYFKFSMQYVYLCIYLSKYYIKLIEVCYTVCDCCKYNNKNKWLK